MRTDRSILGLRKAFSLGRWPFPVPLGYLKVHDATGSHIIIDPHRGPVIREGFERFATGLYTQRQVLTELAAQGLRTRKGNKLSLQSFNAMLRHEFYVGTLLLDPNRSIESTIDRVSSE